MSVLKKVAAIHDLSGFGRSSLTTIIPILATMKVQVCPLPTAILSNQTSGFESFSFVDLTDSMEEYINEWKKLDLSFECIYSGFLGSVKQIQIVSEFIKYFGNDSNLVLVDPVLGDDGELYATMNQDMVDEMKKLVMQADIITPNFTEAAFLLNELYKDFVDEEEIKHWAWKLSMLGPRIVIITSVPQDRDGKNTCVIAYDKENDVYWRVSCAYIPASYPGTGDTFASVVIGSLLQGDSLPISLERGVQFITQCIKASYGFDYPKREGVLLEKMLDVLKEPAIIGSYEMLK